MSGSTLVETRQRIEDGWTAVSEFLMQQGQVELAARVRQFVGRMTPPRTEREQIQLELMRRLREQQIRSQQPTR